MRYACVAILCACACIAQENQGTRTTQTGVGTAVSDPIVDYYRSISDYFRNSERAVQLISDKGIKDEEIPAVLLIARRSSASPNAIIEMRKSGKQFEDIAAQHKVKLPSGDFVREANILFLSEYHGRKPDEVRQMNAKGATFLDINQQLRRVGMETKKKTEQAR